MEQAVPRRPELSIVTTMYRSASFIHDFYTRITKAAAAITDSYEILFVNDGSPDNSLQIAMTHADDDCRVRVIDLSRNFGHHAAALAGLRHAGGSFIFIIDIDLEEKPEWLSEFWEDLHSSGADLVYGVQSARGDGGFKRLTASLFYTMFNLASDTPIPRNVCTVRLMNRAYGEAMAQFTEPDLYLAGLYSWTGFTQRPRYVSKTLRAGKSTYTLLKSIKLFVNAVSSFSSYPLTVFFAIGVCMTVLSLLIAARLFIVKLMHPQFILSGYASLMVSLWFIGGVLISILGVIGMYVGKIFIATKARPQYVVRRIYGGLSGDGCTNKR